MAVVTGERLVAVATLAGFLLASCDAFYGPKLANGYGTTVSVAVTYSNGEVSKSDWPPCLTSFVGKGGVAVVSIAIEKDGRQLRYFASDEITAMLGKEACAQSYSAWWLGPEGVTFVMDATPCNVRQ